MRFLLFVLVGGLSIAILYFFVGGEVNIQPPIAPIVAPQEEKEQMLNPKKVKKIVVYDFWAPWCPPCRAFSPTFESWKNKYGTDSISFVKINIEEDQQAAVKYKISSIPTVIVTVDDEEVKRWTGAPRESDLVEYLK